MTTTPWFCPRCGAVVFVPDEERIACGPCVQQDLGCDGEIDRMSRWGAAAIRGLLRDHGIAEHPWLTLVPPAQCGDGAAAGDVN